MSAKYTGAKSRNFQNYTGHSIFSCYHTFLRLYLSDLTGYGLDGPGSSPGGGKIFRTSPDHRASCRMGTGSFPGVKCGPLLVPLVMKE